MPTWEPRKTLMSSEAALVVDAVTAGYGGGDILHEVSFTVPRGEITCVVGPNGAGKSTLMAAISGLLRPRAAERRAADGQEPAAGTGPGHRPGAAEPQPVPGDDGPGEHRPGRLHAP